jgi:hypothetical protein
MATDRPADSGRDVALTMSQQPHSGEGLAAQHARVAFTGFAVVQADAWPTIDSIPTIAARTTQGSRE